MRTKPITAERPNIIEYDDGKIPIDLHHNIQKSHSGPHIILPDVPTPLPSLRPAQTPRVYIDGTISNLRSSRKQNTFPKYALEAKTVQVMEANAVTHPISGVA